MNVVKQKITGDFKATFEINETEAKDFVIEYLHRRFCIPYNSFLAGDAKRIFSYTEYEEDRPIGAAVSDSEYCIGHAPEKNVECEFVRNASEKEVLVMKLIKILEK